MEYDVIIIGAGPGGYTAAIRGAQEGLKVALIEKDNVGGTCLNRGCIPTKSLLHSSALYKEIREASQYGVNCSDIKFDEERAYKNKEDIVTKLRGGVLSLIKANKIDLFFGTGQFVDSHSVKLNDTVIKGKNIIVATGSSPAIIPIAGIEYAINSDEVLRAPQSGSRVVIIGGGVIGVELAGYYLDLGRSVTIIEAMDRLIPMFSKDLSQILTLNIKKKKGKVVVSTKVVRIEKEEEIKVIYEEKGEIKEISADVVIVSTGRKGNIQGLDLDIAGVITEKGVIKIDENNKTSVDNVYAIGDVCGGIQLAHRASAQAIAVIDNIMGRTSSINLSLIPSCIYTKPEIAFVGICEDGSEDIEVGKFLMGANGKAAIEGYNTGFAKTIINKTSGKIIGAELCMPNATDIIGELALAIGCGITREQFLNIIHPHPTFVEAIYESVEDSEGKAIHLMPRKNY